jgi:hypothetical protein
MLALWNASVGNSWKRNSAGGVNGADKTAVLLQQMQAFLQIHSHHCSAILSGRETACSFGLASDFD